MARAVAGPGQDEVTLILNVGESGMLTACLDEAIASLDQIESADIPGAYRHTLSHIREALRRAHVQRTEPRG